MKKAKRRFAASILTASALSSVCLTAGAATIDLTSDLINPSFESPQASYGSAVPGWSGNGGEEGSGFPSPLPSPASGNDYVTLGAYGTNNLLTQTSSATVTSSGEVLTLTIADGHRSDGYAFNPNILLEFVLGRTTIDQSSSAATYTAPSDPGAGEFALATLQYTTTTADIGQMIGVGVGGQTRTRISLDNVNLTAEIPDVPEPASASFLGIGALLLMSARVFLRQKRASFSRGSKCRGFC